MLTRKIKILNLTDHILEGIFLNEDMRIDINDCIYNEVANELKDLKYEEIYISNVEKAVVKVLFDKITRKIYY